MEIYGQTLEEQIINAKKMGKSLVEYRALLFEEEIEKLGYAEWEKNMTEEKFYYGWTEDEIRHHKDKLNEPFIQMVVSDPKEKNDALSFEDLF